MKIKGLGWVTVGVLLLAARVAAAQRYSPVPAWPADSLRRVVAAHPADAAGQQALLGLAQVLAAQDTAQAGQAGRAALALAGRRHDPHGQAAAHLALGQLLDRRGYPSSALRLLSTAARGYQALGDSFNLSTCYRGLGRVYNAMDQYKPAMQAHLRALRLRQGVGEPAALADSYCCIGQVYVSQHNYPEALVSYREGLRRWRALGQTRYVVGALDHLAIIHRDAGRYDSAHHYLRQGMAVADSAGTAGLLISLGVLEKRQGHFAGAARAYQRALRLRHQQPVISPEQEADLCSLLGEALVLTGRLEQARYYLQRSLDNALACNSPDEQMDAFEGFSELAGAEGDFKQAIAYRERMDVIKDTLHSRATARTVAELHIRYETEQQVAENRIQALQLAAQRTLLRRRAVLLGGTLLLAALLAGLGFLYVSRRRLRREIEFAQERQQLTQLRAQAVLEAEEAERQRIGSDLHDGVGQLLAVARFNLHALDEELRLTAPGPRAMLQNAREVVNESFVEVREISHNLLPNALIKRGLTQAVRDFLSRVSPDDRLKINLEVVGLDGGQRLNRTVENVLFRVIQELVQNIIKHAQASEVTLQFVRRPQELTVMVQDNGVGFDPAATLEADTTGIGLKNIESRLAFLGGRAEFDSRPGHGTTVTLEVPV